MLWIIFLVLAVLIGVFAGVVVLQPAAFRVARSLSIQAPPETVFALVDDFHQWDIWSPWAKIDPAMQKTYGGPPAGTGATYAWLGNSKVGQGRMAIVDSQPPSRIQINLEFIKPFAAKNVCEFTFQPAGNQTVVTWAMTGPKNFVTKAMGLFVTMDKMIGGDFEKGLATMKTTAEQSVVG